MTAEKHLQPGTQFLTSPPINAVRIFRDLIPRRNLALHRMPLLFPQEGR